MTDGRRPVTFLGVLPPPVNGMTLASAAVVEALSSRCDLRVIRISHPRWHRGLVWRVLRGAMYLRAAKCLRSMRPRAGERLYLVANARGGLRYDLMLARIAAKQGWRIVLHHQVYSYLHTFDQRMATIDALMGEAGLHVCLCPRMIDRFRELYPSKARFVHLPNTIAVHPPIDDAAAKPSRPLTIGHISNLSVEKGLDTVLATHRALVDAGAEVKLLLAGPCQSSRERTMVEDACRNTPGVTWLGPVYDEQKWAFFRGIDAMLFPTRYASEAQPLVVAEAILSGVPVIATNLACIAGLVGEAGGACVSANDAFVDKAVALLSQWAADRDALAAARQRAMQRGQALRREADAKLTDFLGVMSQ